MPNKDLNRSNNTGTGAKTLDREDFPPKADVQELSDKAGIAGEPQPAPAEGGSSGGDLQREIGSIDEEKSAFGGDPQPTSVHKGQKPNDGDEPSLPNRDGESGS